MIFYTRSKDTFIDLWLPNPHVQVAFNDWKPKRCIGSSLSTAELTNFEENFKAVILLVGNCYTF